MPPILQQARSPLSMRAPSRQQFFTSAISRPRPQNQWIRLRQATRRKASGASGENKTGHIETNPQEGILFFDNVYPLSNAVWDFRRVFRLLARGGKIVEHPHIANTSFLTDPLAMVKRAIPESLPLKVTEIVPKVSDGGAFVKFSYPESLTLAEIEAVVAKYLKEKDFKPWFSPFRRIRGYLVRGKPWLEDLHRFPSPRLKVEFAPSPGGTASELSEEALYSYFRRYGRIERINPMPEDSKAAIKFAFVQFSRVRDATAAKSCMHGYVVGLQEGGGSSGTVMRIAYNYTMKAHVIREWLLSHPRITIPLAAALGTTLAVAVFDPIRTFFIRAHVNRSFHLGDTPVWRWLVKQTNDLVNMNIRGRRRRSEDEAGLKAIWEQRQEEIADIQSWLMQTHGTFIVVQGPRGSGKRELVVDEVLKNNKRKLVVDCQPIQEARSDSAKIGAAAEQVGYWPVFSWVNSFSSMIDLAAQGTIGTKTGFSETVDAQLAKILQNTAEALKSIALDGRKKTDRDAGSRDDVFLEEHPEKRPVVVIDNFLHQNEGSSMVHDKLAEWAAILVNNNIAHVIFLTTDVGFSKALSKALPDRIFHEVTLGDCTPEVARKFVINHLDADPEDDIRKDGATLTPSQRRSDLGELEQSMSILGGRLTDLEFLARRMKTGESPSKAVEEIIAQSASEILKMYLLNQERSAPKWTATQAWLLVKRLAKFDSLRINEVLLSDVFKKEGQAALAALEQAELISVTSKNGRPSAVHPGKPVFKAAFRVLLEDRVIYSQLELATLAELVKGESATIEKCEQELLTLGKLPGRPMEVSPRVRYLLGKVMDSQMKIEGYEKKSGELKKTLKNQY